MLSHFKLKINFLIFLFHIDLNKIYNNYFIHYIQNHKSINDINIESTFLLKYVIRRFINIVINFFSEREKFNYIFFTQRLSHRFVISFLKQRYIIIDSQKDAVKGFDDYQVLRFIKWCIHCKTTFYIKIECDKLENKPFKKKTITITITISTSKTIMITNLKIKIMMIRVSKSVVAITTILIARFMSFTLLRLIFRNRNDKL